MIEEILQPNVQQFIHDHLYDDPAELMLKANQFADIPLKEAIEQIKSKRKAKTKLPEWFGIPGLVYPPSLSMEQCSSELTAQYKVELVNGDRLLDLTGGFGVDIAYMAEEFTEAHYVERNKSLSAIVKHNFKVLDKKITVHSGEGGNFLQDVTAFDVIYLDPARRGEGGGKVVQLEDYSPNVVELMPRLLEKSMRVLIKASPMLDIKGAMKRLPHLSEIHVVATKNEVKELLFLIDSSKDTEPNVTAVDIGKEEGSKFTFKYSEEGSAQVTYSGFEQYLYEPSNAVMKSGAFKLVSERFGLSKLHPNSHLFTSDRLIEEFPGRSFQIIDTVSLNKKRLKKQLPEMKANITVRNYPLSVDQIRKKIGLKEGGDQYIFATTTQEGPQAVLCSSVKNSL